MTLQTSRIGKMIHCLQGRGIPEYDNLASIAETAHKFQFDADRIFDKSNPESLNSALDYAKQLIDVGLFCLPFSSVIFEWNDFTGTYGDEQPGFEISSWCLVAWSEGEVIRYRIHEVGYSGRLSAEVWTHTWNGQKDLAVICRNPSSKKDDNDEARMFEAKLFKQEEEWGKKEGYEGLLSPAGFNAARGAMVLFYSIAVLNLGSGIKMEEVKESSFTNARRIKKGKPRDYTYSIITIDPEAVKVPGNTRMGSHASPRVHWRRGHIRRLQSGKTIFIKAFLVGVPDGPILESRYVVGRSQAVADLVG